MQISGMSLDFHPFPQGSNVFNNSPVEMDIWRVFGGFFSLFSRLGFLGILHMEVFNQRLEQEYNASVILTTPTVPYKAVLSSAKLIKVS